MLLLSSVPGRSLGPDTMSAPDNPGGSAMQQTALHILDSTQRSSAPELRAAARTTVSSRTQLHSAAGAWGRTLPRQAWGASTAVAWVGKSRSCLVGSATVLAAAEL